MIHLHLTDQNWLEIISTSIEVIRAGGLIIFPTETTYGAGVDATNQKAVDKLLAYKSRREGKPLSIAVPTQAEAEKYVELSDEARRVYQRFLPGPVTVVSKSRHVLAKGVESEFGTLGIRIPNHDFLLELLRQAKTPITATSANGSGEKRPYAIQDIFDGLSEKQKNLIDLVIDAGQLPSNPPSTVIDTTLSAPVVFRQGDTKIIDETKTSTLLSRSETETQDIAKRLLLKHWNALIEHGVVIGLNGSLGMGKTVFVKGAAQFLQINEAITSPTYTYVQEHTYLRHGQSGVLAHWDVWKIEDESEMDRLGFEHFLRPKNLIVVEWSNNIRDYLQKVVTQHGMRYLEVAFSSNESEQRVLEIQEV